MTWNKIKIRLSDSWHITKNNTLKIAEKVLFLLSITTFLTAIIDIGFLYNTNNFDFLHPLYSVLLTTYTIILFIRIHLSLNKRIKPHQLILEIFIFLILLVYTLNNQYLNDWFTNNAPFLAFLNNKFFLYITIAIIFVVELSKNSLHLYKLNFNPAILFIASFLFLVLFGAGMLMLPNSTPKGITFTNALFTSTSAVCVTGLTAIDTATSFTFLGKAVILMLIQLGGLGVMTFTSLFGFFFKGGSFQNQIFLKDFSNTDKISDVFKSLMKIVALTMVIEIIGAIFIFFNLESTGITGTIDKIQFSVFHSISAFCNAGFSTVSNNFYDIQFRFNYNIQLIISFLIIFGGIGFPIMFNYYKFIKTNILNRLRHLFKIKEFEFVPRLININTKIVVYTTIILLLFGTTAFFIIEYNNTLKQHNLYGKIVLSFFNSVTPRTAGFNNVDMSQLLQPTILIIILLMWIGASPASTGGGIKTTTFAVAILNTFSVSKGKDRLEIFKREITTDSVRRAFAVILLSAIVLGLAIFLCCIFEPDKTIISLAFECFSAFGTVGLSLNLTPLLSDASKYVLIITMLLGRVGTLTLIIGLVRKVRTLNYHYPSESIFIN